MRLFFVALAVLTVSACTSDPVERTAYESLRRHEERRPNPGSEPKTLPSYDEYRRQNRIERI